MILYILRGVFVLLVASVAMLYILPFQKDQGVDFTTVMFMVGGALGVGAIIVAVDVLNRKKNLSSLSGVFLGLVGGLLAAFALSFVVSLIGVYTAPEMPQSSPAVTMNSVSYMQLNKEDRQKVEDDWKSYRRLVERRESYLKLLEGVKVFIGLITCYIGMSLVLQTKDDFRFIIPYVEFAKEIRGNRPILLDTSVIIDGRIVDLLGTNIFQGSLIVPKFVLEELQTVADSADKLKRARGRRGLDMLEKLQANPSVQISIDETEAEGTGVDQKLVSKAQVLQARIMTNDFNLNKIASLRGIDVINLNDLAQAMRPVALPGELMKVRIVKPGEASGQGVGYLPDGTMIVVEGARTAIGQEADIVVTSMLQTSAGRMLFARMGAQAEESHANGVTPTPSASSNPTSPPSAPTPLAPTPLASTSTGTPANDPNLSPRPYRGPSQRNPRRG